MSKVRISKVEPEKDELKATKVLEKDIENIKTIEKNKAKTKANAKTKTTTRKTTTRKTTKSKADADIEK